MPPPTPTPMPVPYVQSRILFVEGKTPLNFFEAITRHLAIRDSLEIHSFGGNTQLRAYLATAARTEGFRKNVRSVGVIRDAEDNPAGALDAVRDAITAAKFPATVTARWFILPDSNTPGNIESLCLRSVQLSPAFPCLAEFVNCTAARGVVWPNGHSKDKALVQVFGATLPEPQPHAGLAAQRRAWPWDDPAFAELTKFLTQL